MLQITQYDWLVYTVTYAIWYNGELEIILFNWKIDVCGWLMAIKAINYMGKVFNFHRLTPVVFTEKEKVIKWSNCKLIKDSI